jgi:predicted nucleic acid-binding protein
VTEIVSALARRVRDRAIVSDLARRVQHVILAHLDAGVYERVELTRDVHRRAEHLLLSPPLTPLRAADALHLALAAAAGARSIATFDARLGAAARGLGLVTYPP